MMTNNMLEALNKHQKYREKNRKKVRKRSKQHYEDKRKVICQRNMCEEEKQKLKEDGKLHRKIISKEDKQKGGDYMKEC